MKHVKIYIVSVLLIVLISNCNSNDWKPPEHLIGTWSGRAEIFDYFKKGKHPSPYSEDSILVEITIFENGDIQGKVGNAEFEKSKVLKNRGWIGRKLNIKTDFIIRGKCIKGNIAPGDTLETRDFSMPFNFIDGNLKGCLFRLEGWKYPDPLLPRLRLEKVN